MIIFSIINEIFQSFFHTKYGVYFTLTARLNLDTKFSLELPDLHLNFVKFIAESQK